MDVETAITARRTRKEFAPEPIDRGTIEALLELAVAAPNHHETKPWRFRVLQRAAIEELARAADDPKLLRSPTAVVVAQVISGSESVALEDYAACAAAVQNIMLGATARGLANVWRTPGGLDEPRARELLELPTDGVRIVGIVHLGFPEGREPLPATRGWAAETRFLR
jgi:nitroreductase